MEKPKCPRCGELMIKRGFNYTKEGKFQRYSCNSCGLVTTAPYEDEVLQKLDKTLKEKGFIK